MKGESVQIWRAKVVRKIEMTPHLIRIVLGGLVDFPSTGIGDEYVALMFAPAGQELFLPEISDDWAVTYPSEAEISARAVQRIYTVSDHRFESSEIDLDVVLHEGGPGSDWAIACEIGEEVGLIEPHGFYHPPPDVSWQLFVCDLTGVPALARILRGLQKEQHGKAVVILTDPDDEIDLPTPAEIDISWTVVSSEEEICEAMIDAVTSAELPADDRFVWVAGEARASRAARKHLRRELGWPQSDFYTCGYWQIDALKWNQRYQGVADEVMEKSNRAGEEAAGDEGAYLDSLEDIYGSFGL